MRTILNSECNDISWKSFAIEYREIQKKWWKNLKTNKCLKVEMTLQNFITFWANTSCLCQSIIFYLFLTNYYLKFHELGNRMWMFCAVVRLSNVKIGSLKYLWKLGHLIIRKHCYNVRYVSRWIAKIANQVIKVFSHVICAFNYQLVL